MTATQKRMLIAAADARREKSERATLDAQIRLAILRDKISAFESAESKRQKVLIQSAVEKLVKSGAINRHNPYAEFNVLEQLARDPSLVTLALTKKIFRA